MFLKFMAYENIADDSTSASYTIIEVKSVEFYRIDKYAYYTDRTVFVDGTFSPFVDSDDTLESKEKTTKIVNKAPCAKYEAMDGTTHHVVMTGNAYLMNNEGKTISCFAFYRG